VRRFPGLVGGSGRFSGRKGSSANGTRDALTSCMPRMPYLLLGALCALPIGCGDEAEPAGSAAAALVAVCTETTDDVPDGAWLCGTDRVVECDARPGTATPAEIFVVVSDGCGERLLVEPGPFPLGDHDVVVQKPAAASAPAVEVCRSRLSVVDTTAPTAIPAHTELWPPNHKLHVLSAADCARVADACDPDLDVHFISASSDEPVDAEGDGSHAPDIVFRDSRVVSLRAERQGTSNGRVYTLGWQARDRAGNLAEGTCTVDVPHDQSKRPTIADFPAYSIQAPPAF